MLNIKLSKENIQGEILVLLEPLEVVLPLQKGKTLIFSLGLCSGIVHLRGPAGTALRNAYSKLGSQVPV